MKTQVAIVGGGPGGVASAISLANKGIQSVIIEKDQFPRFHIGESMTGECGGLVRKLGLEIEMLQRQYPVKHGVRVYGQSSENTFWIPVMKRSDEGELEETTTWQVRRSDFDKMLLDKAKSLGVPIINGKATGVIQANDGTVTGVEVRLENGEVEMIESEMVIDASGQATFLSNIGVAGNKDRGKYDRQLALYAHVTGAQRDEVDNTLIFYEKKNHWGWFIPIDDETVSIGIVAPTDYYKSYGETPEEFFKRKLHSFHPEITRRVANLESIGEVHASSNYSYHIKEFTGKGFICVGDSHRFIDPIFSFGVHFSITEGMMAADAIEAYLADGQGREAENPFAELQSHFELGQDSIEDLVDCFWGNPFAFTFFAHQRYREDIIDLFAGRVYQKNPSPGLAALRTVNAQIAEQNMTVSAD